jgi:hemin uptake protein HemP
MYHVRSSETRRATPMDSCDRSHIDGSMPHPEPRREPVRQAPPPVHDARLLTDGGNEAEIRLDGMRYVLRITRQGKLILTK